MVNDIKDVLEGKLQTFQQITAILINSLNSEDFDSLEEFLGNRQNIIEDISRLKYSENDFREASTKLKLQELENTLNKLMNEKKQAIKAEMEKVKTVKKASNNYQKNLQADSMFFNKKI